MEALRWPLQGSFYAMRTLAHLHTCTRQIQATTKQIDVFDEETFCLSSVATIFCPKQPPTLSLLRHILTDEQK